MKAPRSLLTALGLATFAAVSAVHANLIVNGGFESPGAPVPSGGYITYLGGQSFPGWSVGGESIDIHDNGHTAAHSGQYSLDLAGFNNPGSITQTIPTVSGRSYVVDVWYAGHPYHPYSGNALADLSWDGNILANLSIPPAPGVSASQMNWTHYQTTVVAAGNASIFSLIGASPNGGVIVDDISVTAVPTPDGGSSIGLMAAVGATGLFLRRKANL